MDDVALLLPSVMIRFGLPLIRVGPAAVWRVTRRSVQNRTL